MEVVGQWIGTFQGPKPGLATLSFERGFAGNAILAIFQDWNIPATRIDFSISIQEDQIKGHSTQLRVFATDVQKLTSANSYTKQHPDLHFPSEIAVDGKILGNQIIGNWKGDQDTHGTFEFTNNALAPTRPADHTMKWSEFKTFVAEHIRDNKDGYFRGQTNNQWKLKTSFHRYQRYDLLRYEQQDLSELVHRVNALSDYQYDLQKPNDYGALLSLAQHHGFPTPLLDWTRSPYIAAFFALDIPPVFGPSSDGSSRIFVFDGQAWSLDPYQPASITNPYPAITIHVFPAHHNPRHLPQQSVHFFCNVEEVEYFIQMIEDNRKTRYLTSIDIPHSERDVAMRELAYMGVSAATLFPGVEGVCRTLREKYYH